MLRYFSYYQMASFIKLQSLPINFCNSKRNFARQVKTFRISCNMEPLLYYWHGFGFITRILIRPWMCWTVTCRVKCHSWEVYKTCKFLPKVLLTTNKRKNKLKKNLISSQPSHQYLTNWSGTRWMFSKFSSTISNSFTVPILCNCPMFISTLPTTWTSWTSPKRPLHVSWNQQS